MQELAQNFVDGHEDGIENVHYASFCVSAYLERGMGPAVEDHIIHTFSTSGDCSATVTYLRAAFRIMTHKPHASQVLLH